MKKCAFLSHSLFTVSNSVTPMIEATEEYKKCSNIKNQILTKKIYMTDTGCVKISALYCSRVLLHKKSDISKS